jgi:Arc/MetJ-type ribon-helix-helix transcriptional regulator
MTISVRLDPETENSLREHLRRDRISLSDFVRDAVREKLAHYEKPLTPHEIGAPLFGRYASGEANRSSSRKHLLREKIGAKHRR